MENVLAVCVAVLFLSVFALARKVSGHGTELRRLEGVEPASPVLPAGPVSPAGDGISPEIVAAISAAVFCAYPGAQITSLRRAPERPRSAWREAGLLESTRPF